jgi:hypothetical protein
MRRRHLTLPSAGAFDVAGCPNLPAQPIQRSAERRALHWICERRSKAHRAPGSLVRHHVVVLVVIIVVVMMVVDGGVTLSAYAKINTKAEKR